MHTCDCDDDVEPPTPADEAWLAIGATLMTRWEGLLGDAWTSDDGEVLLVTWRGEVPGAVHRLVAERAPGRVRFVDRRPQDPEV